MCSNHLLNIINHVPLTQLPSLHLSLACCATAVCSNHLLNIINDILDVAALKEGKLTIKHEAVDLAKAAEHVCDIVSPLAKKEVSFDV